ncbi:hypothetical protein M3557_14280 [Bhargavaea ginsengi]|uniref:hypothetical protein n=1 Tax=Bhargavaea ginsengi TaxID=426757 RepID=UPI0020404D38|nr:hypothetical protein [Bhargavaea ginsengi]MCM3089084.1 hypothetical protein [Bhargavaea ginsengi]
MQRSLPFLYLLTLLIIGFTGGTILFRFAEAGMAETVTVFLDPRLDLADPAKPYRALLSFLAFHVLALFLASHAALRHAVMFIAGLRAVFFGFASTYLISQEGALTFYAAWWFPAQLLLTLLFTLFCMNLSPPFMLKNYFSRHRKEAVIRIAALSAAILAAEIGVFIFLDN